MFLQLKGLKKIYEEEKGLKNLDLEIEEGSFVTLLGPSGCGKTTTLNLLGGFIQPDSGHILLEGEDITGLPPERRPVSTVFQSYALFPHLNVLDNVCYGLRFFRGMKKKEAAPIAMEELKTVGLSGYETARIGELSGGQQQRVALARAMATGPKILLLDEPLSNLDAKLRVDMRAELKRLHHETGTTIIYVTHDQVEALTMSTRIALYRKGELVQVAPPLELYDNPVNLYTADFIGNPSINFVKGTAQVEAGGMRVDSPLGQLGFERGDMTEAAPQSGSVDVTIGVRPEQLSISRQADDAHWVEGHVYSGMPAGSETLVSVRVGDTMLTVKELGSTHYASDEPVYLGFNPKKVNVFETKSENLIKYCV